MKNIRLQIKRIRTRLNEIYDCLRREAVYSLDRENSEQADERALALALIGEALASLEQI